MGIETAVLAAGANLASNALSSRSRKKDVSKANRRSMAMANTEMANLMPAYQQAQDTMIGGYGQAQDAMIGGYGQAGQINQEALNRAYQMQGQSFMPRMQAYQGGNVAAQNANLSSIPAMRAALLGGRIPQMQQAQSLPIDQAALAGLINPQAQQFPAQQQFSAQQFPQMRPFQR
jgi:hypothetical protein